MKFYWANGKNLLLIALLSVFSMLSACGKTGALYLPDENAQQQETSQQKKQSKE